MPEQLLKKKEIHCNCGKLLAKIDNDGIIYVWCKSCKKEVPIKLEVEQHEQKRNTVQGEKN